MRPAPDGYLPGDPVTPLVIAAADIAADWRRARAIPRWASTIRISDPATAPQILYRYGLTRESAKRRTRLLARARAGDPEARRLLRRVYGCVVYQKPEVAAWRA